MAIFGGLGPLGGPVVGAVIFAYLEQILITRFPYFYMLLFGIVMVISVVFLPQGMAGLIQQWRLRGMEGKYAHS
jgi:branched-chain amino acid transport system permease protein